MRAMSVTGLLISLFMTGCAGAGRHPQQPPLTPGALLFSNFNPGDKANYTWGGWRVGGVGQNKKEDAAVEVGFLFSPDVSGPLRRMEMVMRPENKACTVLGTIRADNHGPGEVLAMFSFFVPSAASEELVSVSLPQSLRIDHAKKYWIILEPKDRVEDSTFWYRREHQPETMIAVRHAQSESWHMNGAYGAMLRMYAE